MGLIIYDGKSSTDYGIVVEKFPAIKHGAKRGEPYQIAGRNGVFYDEDGTFDNYVQAYQIAIREGLLRPADKRCADIQAWLSAPGFKRLEDSFEPEYYKQARFAGPLNVEQIMGRWGRCTLEFECQPERWLKIGEKPITADTSILTIHNPTPYTAKPLIEIVRTGDTTISIGNAAYMMISYGSGMSNVVIDCDVGTITAGGLDMYGATSFYTTYYDFPELPPGDVTISATNATRISVTPRWYLL